MRDTVLGVPVTKIRGLSALSWPPLYGTYHLHQDPGERYLGPWAQYTFPQKEHLGHNQFLEWQRIKWRTNQKPGFLSRVYAGIYGA